MPSHRDGLQMMLEREIAAKLARHRDRLLTEDRKKEILAEMQSLLEYYGRQHGLLPVPKIVVLHHRIEHQKILVTTKEVWEKMQRDGESEPWVATTTTEKR